MFLPRSLVQTLEELSLCNFITDLDPTDTHVPANISAPWRPHLSVAPYPAVHSLHLRVLLQRPLLDRLQHFFPALDGILSIGPLDSCILDGNACDNLHAANRRAQDGAPRSRACAWKKLGKLVCDPRMRLFVLGLRYPVRLVMLDNCSAYTKWLVAIALGDNPVPRLKLTFRLLRKRRDDVLDGLFSPALARTMTHLTACLVFGNDSGSWSDADRGTFEDLLWEDLLNTILSALRPLHELTHLRIVVHSSIHRDPDSVFAYWEDFVRATRPAAFDFAGTAALLARRPLPSLRYLFLTTSGYVVERIDTSASRRLWKLGERWRVDRAWCIANPEPVGTGSGHAGERVLVGLHEGVAETIMRNEELVLSEVDQPLLQVT